MITWTISSRSSPRWEKAKSPFARFNTRSPSNARQRSTRSGAISKVRDHRRLRHRHCFTRSLRAPPPIRPPYEPQYRATALSRCDTDSTNENALLEGSRDRANVLPGQSPGTPMLSEITVGGENATLPDLYQLNLCVTAVAEGEDGGAVQLEAGDTPEAWGPEALPYRTRRGARACESGPWSSPRRLEMATR